MSDDNDLLLRVWEKAETAIVNAAMDAGGGDLPARSMAKAAAVAVLREVAEEIRLAEEDDVMWPDSDDLLMLAGELEDEDV